MRQTTCKRGSCVKLPEYGKKSKNWLGPKYQDYWRCMYCGRKTKWDSKTKWETKG